MTTLTEALNKLANAKLSPRTEKIKALLTKKSYRVRFYRYDQEIVNFAALNDDELIAQAREERIIKALKMLEGVTQ